jgi:hypothetical protein
MDWKKRDEVNVSTFKNTCTTIYARNRSSSDPLKLSGAILGNT